MPFLITDPDDHEQTRTSDSESIIVQGVKNAADNHVFVYLMRHGSEDRFCGEADLDGNIWAIKIDQVPKNHGYIIHAVTDRGKSDSKHRIVLS